MKRKRGEGKGGVVRLQDRGRPAADELRTGAGALIRVAAMVMEASSELIAIDAEWVATHVQVRAR